ncbi:hypothetical protein Emag_002864 [Eimeria magna]
MLEQGIRPVYVFDGTAPEQKAAELEKRRERREEAEALAAAAKESGDREELRKQLARTVRVSPQQNQEVQQLLQLLGLPVVIAPGEAEAQCAELAKSGKAWAAATEDADALTFGTPILIRNLTFSDSSTSSGSKAAAAGPGNGGGSSASSPGSKTHPVLSIHLAKVLEELKLSMDQFIDFCILCGCDYCGTIRGVGAKTAYTLIKQHGCIEQDRSFNEARVDGYLARLRKARSLGSQTRLEAFFGSAVSKASDLKQKQLKAAAEIKKRAANNSNKKRKPEEAGRSIRRCGHAHCHHQKARGDVQRVLAQPLLQQQTSKHTRKRHKAVTQAASCNNRHSEKEATAAEDAAAADPAATAAAIDAAAATDPVSVSLSISETSVIE